MGVGSAARVRGGVSAGLLIVAVVGCGPSVTNDPIGTGLVTIVEQPVGDMDEGRTAVVTSPSEQDGGGLAGDQIVIEGRDLLLVPANGGDPRHLASLDDDDGEVVHVSRRPGRHTDQTVLAVAKVHDDRGRRFELRYLVASPNEITDLYWFPWRLQIDEDTAEVLDVVPVPVWSPDGAALAWIEWDADGTRLRTVGWLDHDEGSNPSDAATAYALNDVPRGTQLESWVTAADGTPLLIGSFDGQRWSIRLESESTSIALAS